MDNTDLQCQRKEWRKKGWSIPDLRGGKQNWFVLVVSIVNAVGNGTLTDLNEIPSIEGIDSLQPFSEYYPFFRGIGFLQNQSGIVSLTTEGHRFLTEPSKRHLAYIIHNKYRLFGEVL